MITIQRIIAQALRDAASFVMLRGALTSTLAVPNPYQRKVVTWVAAFWDQYRQLPKAGDYEFWLTTLNEQDKGGVEQVLGEVLTLPEEDWTSEYITSSVTDVLRDVAARAAVARLGTMVPDVKPEAFEILTEEIRRIQPITIHGLKDMADVSQWIFSGHDELPKVATGFAGLNQFIGGFRSELVFVLADSGVGKTSLLVNLGANAALRGARVFHITFELSAENTLKRYYRRVSESPPGEVRQHPEIVVDRVNHWLRFAKGSVHVLYQQPYGIGADELRALVDQFVQLHGGVDLVILDYLDLMKPPESKSEYEGLGKLSHMVRNIGIQHEATMLSATQATRGAHRVRHLRLDMMGDSYRKVQAADIIIGFLQADEEYEANQGRLALLKIRENPGRGAEVPVYVNLDLMLIADLDSANTRRIAQNYRHSTHHVFVPGDAEA